MPVSAEQWRAAIGVAEARRYGLGLRRTRRDRGGSLKLRGWGARPGSYWELGTYLVVQMSSSLLLGVLLLVVAAGLCYVGRACCGPLCRLVISVKCSLRGSRAVHMISSSLTSVLRQLVALSLLLVRAGDVEMNPGPLNGEKGSI